MKVILFQFYGQHVWKTFDCKRWIWSFESTEYSRKELRKTVSSHIRFEGLNVVPTLYKLTLFADEATMQDILTFVCKELRAHSHFRLLLLLIFFSRGRKLQLEIMELSKVIYCIWIFVNKVMLNSSSPWLDRVRTLYKSRCLEISPKFILKQQQTEMYKVSHLAKHIVVFALRMF